ncbi:hypothetical protein [Vibrio quintilis]|uniref:hypothetical protein n=1 Tax=Vibrio quintilis TaxID=1117707 RepID=UPI00093649F5|nr:hypothetical protein [Vibrio quintilis]
MRYTQATEQTAAPRAFNLQSVDVNADTTRTLTFSWRKAVMQSSTFCANMTRTITATPCSLD